MMPVWRLVFTALWLLLLAAGVAAWQAVPGARLACAVLAALLVVLGGLLWRGRTPPVRRPVMPFVD